MLETTLYGLYGLHRQVRVCSLIECFQQFWPLYYVFFLMSHVTDLGLDGNQICELVYSLYTVACGTTVCYSFFTE